MKKILCVLIILIFLASSTSGMLIKQDSILKTTNRSDKYFEQCNDKPKFTMNLEDLPSQFSWKNLGGDWMTPVKDCHGCGSGWATSALDVFEAAINIAKCDPDFDRDLSEQYILSCLSAAGSCSGGWMSKAIEYIKSTDPGSTGNGINGCPLDSCMPYQMDDTIPCSDKCENWDYYTDPPQEDNILWQIEDFGVSSFSEDSPEDWNTMKSWIVTHGPIVADIYASTSYMSYWQSHHDVSDVYQIDDSGTSNIGVAICGWVDDADILNGGYWILKHNWGSGWGNGGYANIAYGCNSLGTRDVTWVHAADWVEDPDYPIPDLLVFSNFDYSPKYVHPGDEIDFTDSSQGNIVLWQWDFDGDGIIDSNKRNPTKTYDQEGEYQVTLTVTNQDGISNSLSKKIGVFEVWPPIAIIKPEQYPDPDNPDNSLEVHFDARYSYDQDDGDIVNYLWDFDDGTTTEGKYLYHTFPEYDRIYEVTLTLTDNDGGVSTETCEVKIDKTVPPETSIHHGFGSDNTEWYSETQRIFFTSTDWTRVINTYYRVDGGNWIRYAPGQQEYVIIASEGMHTIEAYSIDYYGNQETPVSDIFGIDKTIPNLEVSLSGDQINGEYIGYVIVTSNANDQLSGIDKIMYKKLGDYSWNEYTQPLTLSESCILDCIAADKAGNLNEETIHISVEEPPSEPYISGPDKASAGEEIYYTFKATDFSPSPEDNIYFYIEWGDGENENWIGPYDSGEEAILSHIFQEKGTYTIKAKAKDSLGAESEESSFELIITKSKVKYLNWNSLVHNIFEIYKTIRDLLL
jgi:PKD repeat protein